MPTMKVSEIVTLMNVISHVQTSAASNKVKFAYMLARNKKLLTPIIDSANESLGSKEETATLARYEEERIRRFKEAAEVGEDGNPVVENDTYKIVGGDKAEEAIVEALEKDFPGAADLMTKRRERFAEVMETNEEVTLYTLPISEWPDLPETVRGDIMDVLMVLVAD